MPDYSKGKIYTIRCYQDPTLIYVGSTVETLHKRWHGHKTQYKANKENVKFMEAINEHGIENFYIELYENYPSETKEQLNQREGEITREIGTLNKNISGRTNRLYIEEHKERLYEINKGYRETHKAEKAETDKKYKENNKEVIKEKRTMLFTCECGKSFQRDGIARHSRSEFHQAFVAKSLV